MFISNIAKDIQRSRLWLQKYQNENPSKRNKNILSGFYRKKLGTEKPKAKV